MSKKLDIASHLYLNRWDSLHSGAKSNNYENKGKSNFALSKKAQDIESIKNLQLSRMIK